MIHLEFPPSRRLHQSVHRDALRGGLAALGVSDRDYEFHACWGWRRGLMLRRMGRDVLVLERGYLGDRFAYTSIAWNGLNGRAVFPEYPDDGGARFRRCGFQLRDRKTDGENVLLIGQVATDMAVRDVNITSWESATAARIRQQIGEPLVFRPHPQDVKRRRIRRIRDVPMSFESLGDDLARAKLVVTYSSNTAVDALVRGVPTVAMSKGSMAYGVAAKDIDGVVDWDAREKWAHQLAWKQWTLDEIASGEALKGALECLEALKYAA